MHEGNQERFSVDRAGRLMALARWALAGFGLGGARCELIKDHRNASFRVEHGSARYLLRVHTSGSHSRARVESELQWLEAMGCELAAEVPAPLRSRVGGLLLETPPESPDGPALACMLTWLPGAHVVNPRRTGDQYEQVGRVLGMLHGHGVRWVPPSGFERPSLDGEHLFGAGGQLGETASVAWERLHGPVRRDLEYLWERLREAESALRDDPRYFGLIHGDPSFGNLLFLPGRTLLIDFDDCGWGHFAYDLGVVLSGAWRRDSFLQDCERLVKGYRRVRDLSAQERSLLPVFMAARAGSLLLRAAAKSARDNRIAGEWRRIRFFLGM